MRELTISKKRMRPVIEASIATYRSKTDSPPDCNAVAESMVAAREEYLKCEHVLKHQVSLRNFFELGVWADQRMWVLDREEIRRHHRRL